jgi:hypothetical protein
MNQNYNPNDTAKKYFKFEEVEPEASLYFDGNRIQAHLYCSGNQNFLVIYHQILDLEKIIVIYDEGNPHDERFLEYVQLMMEREVLFLHVAYTCGWTNEKLEEEIASNWVSER